jgi:hypothetical protein
MEKLNMTDKTSAGMILENYVQTLQSACKFESDLQTYGDRQKNTVYCLHNRTTKGGDEST